MTNNLVGDVYAKIIEEVVAHSTTDFEESGVGSTTLKELQAEWQAKLSQRGVAQMPWDPKPQPPAPPQQSQPPPSSLPSATANGLPQSYSYDSTQGQAANGTRIKTEPGTEQYNGLPNGNYQNGAANTQGGLARAQALVQQQYGQAGNASINAMQQQRGGLALPGQQAKPPQGLNLPAGSPQQQSFQQQQQEAMARQQQQQHAAMARQQQQLAQQQAQPRIKVENDSPQLQQGAFTQQSPPSQSYGQTDGADEGMDEWRAMLAERRVANARHGDQADRLMRDNVLSLSEHLQSGLMVPLDEQPSRSRKHKRRGPSAVASSSKLPTIPQLDGDADDEEEKPDVKDEDDENAINSDLDDSDDENGGAMGDDDDDLGDSILCTYDKVQRVKNKWKCTLKDGVMSVNGKEWVFHKGTGEFEW
ncbi:hypothetical protein M409DRAFT_57241 [Zasmidium cellare ATCC 36951]|uniref:Transcription factor IIA, alpha/beta subunit n=1 Tax=Zasmidium cellare ATCC 36951 TaxID=1080233 RepID=A0A6A6C9N5_ZASCE|nr:uncharacterized protein M409DRAFT_57241 [Zasmidium cellare ATCC 36951]KAF2163751.1 hypothetical protein M409DRAFT_57241 [Zasmidium cellare ATCC 36951]